MYFVEKSINSPRNYDQKSYKKQKVNSSLEALLCSSTESQSYYLFSDKPT